MYDLKSQDAVVAPGQAWPDFLEEGHAVRYNSVSDLA